MHLLAQYARFFFFHAYHWSIPLALFSLYHTIRGEKKYGLHSFIPHDLDELTIVKGDPLKSSRYEAVNYKLLEDLLKKFRELYPHQQSLLDAGAGKGRALVVAAHFGFNELTGVEFARELARECRANLEALAERMPGLKFRVVLDDVGEFRYETEQAVFLFNPFNSEILEKLLQNLDDSLITRNRNLYIIYASPKHRQSLEKHNYRVVYEKRIFSHLTGIIAVKGRISTIPA